MLVKIGLPLLIITVLVSLIYLKVFKSSSDSTTAPNSQDGAKRLNVDSPKEVPKTLPTSNESIVSSSDSALMTKINELALQISKLNGIDSRLGNVEKTTDDLKTRVGKLEVSPSPGLQGTTSTISNSSPHYFYALGYGGSTTSNDWTEISTISVTVDPSLYPGYSSMQLEVKMRLKDGNGTGFARLYSEGTGYSQTEVSTSSYTDTWVKSPTFNIAGKKTYTIQLKSLTGYEVFVSDLRIRVNY